IRDRNVTGVQTCALPISRNVLKEVQLLREMASNQGRDMTGPLHMGMIPTIGPYLLPYVIPMLRESFPELEVYLYEAQTHQLLERSEERRVGKGRRIRMMT